MPALPRVLGPDDLPLAELGAARLDGELFALGRGWCPADVPGTPLDRAAGAALGRPVRWIAELRTAAWIWGGLDLEPRPARFCSPSDDGGGHDGAVVRRRALGSRDWTVLGAVRVTSPLRTIVDLARVSEDWEADAAIVRRLAQERRLTPEVVLGAADHDRRLPDGVRARERLRGLYPALTRTC